MHLLFFFRIGLKEDIIQEYIIAFQDKLNYIEIKERERMYNKCMMCVTWNIDFKKCVACYM